MFHVMRNKEHGLSGLDVQVRKQFHHLCGPLWIQTRSGFIQHQDLRIQHQDPGDGHTALLAAGKIEGTPLEIRFIEPHHRQNRFHLLQGIFFTDPEVFGTECDVPANGLLEELVFRKLKHKSDLPAEFLQVFDFHPRQDFAAQDLQFPGSRHQQTIEVLHKRGFSTACLSYDRRHFPLRDPDAGAIQCLIGKGRVRAVHMAQVSGFYRHSSSAASSRFRAG